MALVINFLTELRLKLIPSILEVLGNDLCKLFVILIFIRIHSFMLIEIKPAAFQIMLPRKGSFQYSIIHIF